MMRKRNQTSLALRVLLGLLIVGLTAGCEDQLLNQTPRGEQTQANFFETEEHALAATNATYEKLRAFNIHGFLWLGMTDIASDDADKGSTPPDGPQQRALDEWTFDPTTANFQNTWQEYYRGIFRANLAITNIPDIDMDSALQERLVAENKFLRAYFYFYLVRAFGGVPLITEALEPDEFQQPRASAGEVYSLIEQDLQDAAQVLPSNYPAADLGRITRGAAQGLLAKVFLFQEKYEEAEQAAQDVIDEEYALYPDYEEIFRPEGENSSESVFEVQTVALETQLGGTPYSQPQGVRGVPNLGWGFNNPSQDLLAAYEPGDPRLGATVLFVYENLPFGPEDVVQDNTNMNDEQYNQKPFVPLDQPGGAASGNGGSNIRRLRYADVLLIAAEAAFQNGNEADARTYVNRVRERARGGQDATIGIEPEALSALVAEAVEAPELEGRPFVRFVAADGPADEAGLQGFERVDNSDPIQITNLDVIEAVDGVPVTTADAFIDEMSTKSPEQSVTVDIQRITDSDTEDLQFTVTTQQLLPDVTASGEALLEAIWHERRVELAMEQHRLFDLRRTSRAGDVLRALDVDFQDNKHELYPIPADEIDLSGGVLEQNPGYN